MREQPEKPQRIVAVGSGKGGVGKSTVAVNLAVALAALGHRVGLLDVLLLDLPPGTAEPHETVARQVKPDGIVLVTTPQEVAQIDTARILQFYEAAHVPVLGTIVNMSYFVCPDCGARHTIWPRHDPPDGPLSYPILAELPLTPAIARAGDTGRPIVAIQPESVAARAFFDAGRRFWVRLGETKTP